MSIKRIPSYQESRIHHHDIEARYTTLLPLLRNPGTIQVPHDLTEYVPM